jgi:hypothetical protein
MHGTNRHDPQPDRGNGPPEGKGRPDNPGRPIPEHRSSSQDYGLAMRKA